MKTLEQLAKNNLSWSLREFVIEANEMLPKFLPVEKGNTKVRELITPRLMRHYTAMGMLDDPHKSGKESRYSYRHMLQLLVVRRLLSEGYGARAIDDLARSSDNAGLEALLHGGAKLQVTVANPALAFLNEIRKRSEAPGLTGRSDGSPISASPPEPASATRWTRTEVLPGLELHIGDNFQYPNSAHEKQAMLRHIDRALTEHTKKGRTLK